MDSPRVPLEGGGRERLDHALLRRLQAARAYPSVSVLLTTLRGDTLTSKDATRLDRLIRVARQRLAVGTPGAQADVLIDRLRRLADAARRNPASQAVALFTSSYETVLVHLPVPVSDRVVVDPSFATRDLVRALTIHPRFRVLVVSDQAARLLEGWPGDLEEVAVPHEAGQRPRAIDQLPRLARRRDDDRQAGSARGFPDVADVLGRRHAADPLPLIVAGAPDALTAWPAVPGVAAALIGTLPGAHDHTPLARLDTLARPIIVEHVRARRRAALHQLNTVDSDRCVGGIDDVWAAATAGQIGLLCVEVGYGFPARTVRAGRQLEQAKDIEHPDVLDDAVDELIELVALAGGETVIVHDGALEGCARVAAVLRATDDGDGSDLEVWPKAELDRLLWEGSE